MLLACSGGPDSLALFDILQQEGKEILCAHVNYHLRPEAEAESERLQVFCKDRSVRFYRRDVHYEKGNLEAWAREERYRFFRELAIETGICTLYVGHHQDDLLETYLMQKEKGITPNVWGLAEESRYHELTVKRPLLSLRKQDLLHYCESRQLPYSLDASNESETYTRNRWRKRVNALSEEERSALLKEIAQRNEALQTLRKEALTFLQEKETLSTEELLNYPQPEELLRQLLYPDLSGKQLQELLKALKSEKNLSVPVREKVLYKQYGKVSADFPAEGYSYVLNGPEALCTEYFCLSEEGRRIEGVTCREEDWPLTVRNARQGDRIALRQGHKSVSRFFIDRQIPAGQRALWPLIVNARGEVIFVAGIGCDVYHFSEKPSFYLHSLLKD